MISVNIKPGMNFKIPFCEKKNRCQPFKESLFILIGELQIRLIS